MALNKVDFKFNYSGIDRETNDGNELSFNQLGISREQLLELQAPVLVAADAISAVIKRWRAEALAAGQTKTPLPISGAAGKKA